MCTATRWSFCHVSIFFLFFFPYRLSQILSSIVPYPHPEWTYPHPEWTLREEREWENGMERRRGRLNKDYLRRKFLSSKPRSDSCLICAPPFFTKFTVIVSLLPVYVKIYYQKNKSLTGTVHECGNWETEHYNSVLEKNKDPMFNFWEYRNQNLTVLRQNVA